MRCASGDAQASGRTTMGQQLQTHLLSEPMGHPPRCMMYTWRAPGRKPRLGRMPATGTGKCLQRSWSDCLYWLTMRMCANCCKLKTHTYLQFLSISLLGRSLLKRLPPNRASLFLRPTLIRPMSRSAATERVVARNILIFLASCLVATGLCHQPSLNRFPILGFPGLATELRRGCGRARSPATSSGVQSCRCEHWTPMQTQPSHGGG